MSEVKVMSKGLATKMAMIMKAIDGVPKKSWNPNQKYYYASDADISEAVREEMCKLGVVMVPYVVEHGVRTITTAKGSVMSINWVLMEFTIIDADNGESLVIRTVGEGMDSGDKGVYKAMTGANKYALLKAFQIATGDDPEATQSDTAHTPPPAATGKPSTPAPSTAPNTAPPATKGAAWTGQDIMGFGKYKESRWMDAEDSYLGWILEKGTNESIKAKARLEVERRSKEVLDELGEEIEDGLEQPMFSEN